MDGKFGTELLVAGISIGMILQHLEGMTLGSDEVKGDGIFLLVATSINGDSSTWVPPMMGTWGGKTIIDGVVANGIVAEQSDFEDRGVNDVWDLVAIISTFKILAAGVPNNGTSNCCINLHVEVPLNCAYGWQGRFSVMPEKKQ